MSMKLTPTLIALVAAGLFSGTSFALSKEEVKAEKERIAAEHKAAKAQCDALSGNAKDVCVKQADGNEKVAKAELDAREKPSEKANYKARLARAEADFDVAKEKCDDLSGNPKDVCKKQAEADFTRAKENAKVAKSIEAPAGSLTEKAANVSEARKDAAAEKNEADYKVAKEKCDALSGDLKDKCINDAKLRFGQK